MSAEPSQELVKPVPPSELARRRLVEIVNAETGQVLEQICTRGDNLAFGSLPAGAAVPAGLNYLNLAGHYDAARLERVSPVHGIVSFLHDGTVTYEDTSEDIFRQHGTVIERRPNAAFKGLPVLRFQVKNSEEGNHISAYLTRSAVTHEAEVQDAVPLTTPDGLWLKNGDHILPGFNYDVIRRSGLAVLVTGASGANTLQPPAAVMRAGKLIVPKLAVYIR